MGYLPVLILDRYPYGGSKIIENALKYKNFKMMVER